MSEIALFEQLTTGNEMYQQHAKRYDFLYRSYVGGQAYKDGQFLTKYQLESGSEYQDRINATPLDNQCASVIAVYNSFLFREEPERDYGSIANLPELADFIEDVDYDGRSLDSFMKEVNIWAGVFGHTWMLLTKPAIDAASKADEQAAGLRPYLSVLTPMVVLDWGWSRDKTGRYALNLFRYVEEVNGSIQTIRTWTTEAIVTSVVDLTNKKVVSETIEVNGLGVIPAVIAYNNRSIIRGIGISAINDIADAQRFIYNATSEVDQSIRLDSHPSLVKTAETQAGVGAGAIIQMPEGIDPGLKPYILEFNGANITSIYESIKYTVGAIEKMAALGAVRSTQSSAMSGVALETEFQLLNARLSEMADNLELAEEQMFQFWCMYQAQPYDMTIEYPGSFNIRDTGSEIAQLKTASDCNPADPRVRQAIDMAILDWMDLDEDEIAALQDPTIMNPDVVTETGQIPGTDN